MTAGGDRGAQLRQEIVIAEQATAGERRRQEVLERAVADGALTRDSAERIYDIAQEEALEPAYALALVRSGMLVRELVPPESSGETMQQDPPPWLDPAEPTGEALVQERRLRASMRRLHAMMHREQDAGRAVDAYLAEPDVAGD